MKGIMKIVKGDITEFEVDAIVNAANTTLLGGGGVDGAIHRAAGSDLLIECKSLGGCHTGESKITKGYNLPAKNVIHTVGPIWRGGDFKEDELLQSCYEKSLALAVKHELKSIAFPSISTGVYSFPFERAARIAINTVKNFLKKEESIEKVIFVCFSDEDYKKYLQLSKELLK